MIVCCSALLLHNCKQEEVNEDTVGFTGITTTNNLGVILSTDTTDWKFNEEWKPQESGLFTSNYPTACQPGFNYRFTGFPNPAKDIFALSPSLPTSARIELRVVDQQFNKLLSMDSLRGPVMIRGSDWNVKGMVRVYYKLIDNNCEFRGHGDILIE